MFYKILILISFSIYSILPIKVFGLEPTSGIVCYALKKKQKTEFLFKRNNDNIFAKAFKRINGNFIEVGNVVGRKRKYKRGDSFPDEPKCTRFNDASSFGSGRKSTKRT